MAICGRCRRGAGHAVGDRLVTDFRLSACPAVTQGGVFPVTPHGARSFFLVGFRYRRPYSPNSIANARHLMARYLVTQANLPDPAIVMPHPA